MSRLSRYFRLLSAFARFCLTNEMAFRGNFVMKVLVEASGSASSSSSTRRSSPTRARSAAGTRTSICSFSDAITPWKG